MGGRTTTRRVIVGTIALAGLVFYAFFFLLVTPNTVQGEGNGIQYELEEDDDEHAGHPHLLTVEAWSQNTPSSPLTVTVHYREGETGPFQALRLQRLGTGSTYAAEMPPVAEGARLFYYVQASDVRGNTVNIPENAPEAPLLHVRWEGEVNNAVLALHIALMIGALFFLVHGLHYSTQILARGAGTQTAVAGKVHSAIRAGWLCFFVGGIPLGIYVSGTALGWQNAWGGWPLGFDITDTKTELLIIYWAAMAAMRPDLMAQC